MDVKKYIGETTEYDKKQSVEIKKPKSWCKSVSAFANGVGGFLIFGIDNEGNIWESNELNASLKRKMMEASEKCYLLVDQSKFEKKSLIQLSGLNKIDTIFTDSALPFPLQKYCDKVDTMTVI